jgi:hypothetical protein
MIYATKMIIFNTGKVTITSPVFMNHYDPFIQDFLAQYKSVSFEKIGHLTVGGDQGIGEHPVTFQYDKKAETSPELIIYIAERTGKNRTLIQSDLGSHFELTRQFINIGKPYELETFGFISLNKSGEYEFTPLESTEGREEHKSAKKKQHDYHIAPQSEQARSPKSFLMFVAFLIIVGVLGVIGWGTYKMFIEKGISNMNDSLATSNIVTPPDSVTDSVTDTSSVNKNIIHAGTDTTTAMKTDTTQILRNDSSNYKFIFERTSSWEKANDRTDELRIILTRDASFDSVKTDSLTIYRLYVKLRLPPADTTRMKDSLQRYFQHSVKIIRSS